MTDSFSSKMYKIFIQARMSSKRFPGKVLASFNGVPIIKCVIDRILNVVPIGQIVVLASQEESDDPLACYLDQLGVAIFRRRWTMYSPDPKNVLPICMATRCYFQLRFG